MTRAGVLAALIAAGAVLIAVELALGARDYGEVELTPPCSGAAPAVQPGGLDATVQRIALRALDAAACELETSREELVLSLSPRSGRRFGSFSDVELEDALREGLVRAIERSEADGEIGSVEARVLRVLAERAPVELVRQAAEHVDDFAALARLFG